MDHQQQTVTKTQIDAIQEIPQDLAWSERERLVNCKRTDWAGVTIFTGTHPEHGNIHIVIPSFGEALLLFPFESRDFVCEK